MESGIIVEPLVSVVIPTYKRAEEVLGRAITSVLNQTYNNVEVLVVDDNLPDSDDRQRVSNMMERSPFNDSRVTYIKNKQNLGGSLTRNVGIEEARGDYITFLDDDDIYLPQKIENQVRFMLNEGVDLSFTDLKLHNPNDQLIDYRDYDSIEEFSNAYLLNYHLKRHITGTPTFMFKRTSLLEIGGFPQAKVGQEFRLMLRAIENNLSIKYLKDSQVVAYVYKGEKISNGANKLNGELELYKLKQSYFHRFTWREKRFISFRHHVVMSVAGLRSSMPKIFIGHALKAVFTSPLDLVKEGTHHVKKLYTQRQS